MTSLSPTRPIVVGYDGSAPSEAALQWAARAAERQERPLQVLHAADRITHTYDAITGRTLNEKVLAQAKEIAQHGVDTVVESFPGLDVEACGSLFTAKVALGEVSTQAWMMVLGSHGRGRVGTLLLGSTAYAVAGYSRCPVVVIRDSSSELPGPERPVLVGVNGTGGAGRAVGTAAEVARELGVPLVLITTWLAAKTDPWNVAPAGYDSVEEATADYRAQAEDANATILERMRAAHDDLDVRGSVLEGHPIDALIRACEGSGLLVLGTRGHGSLAGAVLGSTSLGVLHQATLPIMIVD